MVERETGRKALSTWQKPRRTGHQVARRRGSPAEALVGDARQSGDYVANAGLLSIQVCQQQDTATVRLKGEVDLSTVDQLNHVLDQVTDCVVELDMTDVVFMDSSGLAALVRARHAGTRVQVLGASDNVVRIFKISGLYDLFSPPEQDDA